MTHQSDLRWRGLPPVRAGFSPYTVPTPRIDKAQMAVIWCVSIFSGSIYGAFVYAAVHIFSRVAG